MRKETSRFQELGSKLFKIVFIAFFWPVMLLGQQPTIFTNVAPAMGIQHVYAHSGFWGAGASFCDFNGDDLEDLTIATNAGQLLAVYQNMNTTRFDPVASYWNLNHLWNTKTVLWVDYDNDGDRDLFASNYDGNVRLYRQEAGQLTDVTANSGIQVDSAAITAACWADFDNDGWIDLYVTHQSPGVENRLFRNRGDGSFEDVTQVAGVGDPNKNPLAVVAFDYDQDGWQDIYIASDRFFGNTLFRNNGDGTFTNVSTASGTNLAMHGMGIAVGDYDGDGDPDLYVSNDPMGNALLRNNGDGTFTNVADSAGAAVNRACWGVNFFDFDNDTDLDLFVCVSMNMPSNENVLLENLGNGAFAPATGTGMEGDTVASFGQAIGDFNNDGYCDIAVVNEDAPFQLWENHGGANHWIKIALEGTLSNRDGIGSRIEVYAGGNRLVRTTHCGISYLSQNSPIQTIGVGGATTVDSVKVYWPSGQMDVVYHLAADQMWRIREGQGIVGVPAASQLPEQPVLLPNYPNPFNPVTNVEFGLPNAEWVTLKIYDLLGREVKTLVNRRLEAGYHIVQWDGTDNSGQPVTSGIYLYRLTYPPLNSSSRGEPGGVSLTRKMVLIK